MKVTQKVRQQCMDYANQREHFTVETKDANPIKKCFLSQNQYCFEFWTIKKYFIEFASVVSIVKFPLRIAQSIH